MVSEMLKHVASGSSLSMAQMDELIDWMMQGKASQSQIRKLLVALHEKGETVEELAGAARAIRKHMRPIQTRRENVVDTCGTGGAQSGTFNISTAAAIVAAAAGAAVAKHGNRSATSKSGSADVLVELGVNIECSHDVVQKSLDQLGLCFCFAPLFHPSVKHVMAVRKSLDHPTIFNLLGPLCNPASAPHQLLGAGRSETRSLVANALSMLGTQRSIVVHSRDGMGEISIAEVTDISEVRSSGVTEGSFAPEDFGFERTDLSSLQVQNPAESADVIRRVLDGRPGPARDIVIANASAALWISGMADSLARGADRCADAIDRGHAREMLGELVDITQKG